VTGVITNLFGLGTADLGRVVVDGLAIDANGGRVRMVRDGAETYFSPATARAYADLLALSEIGSPLVAALLDAFSDRNAPALRGKPRVFILGLRLGHPVHGPAPA
jgi:hypothetical protein